jgi:molybdopterin-dependent oxidoreductase alpha subunit
VTKKTAQPPFEKKAPKLIKQKHKAGGASAVLSSMKHIFKETGLVKGSKLLTQINQTDGFDCPGCAWPDPDRQRSLFEFCENGAKAVAEEATNKKADPEFFNKFSTEDLSLFSDYELGKSGRITDPMWLPAGETHYKPITWEKSFELISKKLKSLDHPDQAIFYTSGRTSNEAAFLYQLFVRLYGTNNLPDCSNMCHESSGVALGESIGIGKGSVTLDDFNYADSIFIIGQNPGTNHPRMLTALQKASRNGCEIVTINPLLEAGNISFQNPQELSGWVGPGTKLSSHYVQVKIAGDIALLKGILKVMLDHPEKLDQEFIQAKTSGIEELKEDIAQTDWQEITTESGVSKELILKISHIALNSKNMIWCWAMGMTQHKDAVGGIAQIVNILLLGGHFGRRGAGVCPVRGHSNVQGDRTMGIWEKPSQAFLDNLKKTFKFVPPQNHGADVVESIELMNESKAKVLFCMGGNFLSATPDTEVTARGLENLELSVQVSTKLNRSHVITGKEALILPCLGRTELDLTGNQKQVVTVENSMGVVHSSRSSQTPISKNLRSEVSIVCDLAKLIFKDSEKEKLVDWQSLKNDYRKIRDLIAVTIPGFTDYNIRIEKPGGFYLPNSVRDHCEFKTDTGRAKFITHPIPKFNLSANQFILMSIRTHDQYNTTIYGLDDRYRGIIGGRRVVLMNELDMKNQSYTSGQQINITSHFEGQKRTAKKFIVVPYAIPQGCLATYFPESNVLVPLKSTALKSNTPTSKSIIVSLSSCE